jgi:hypothetical protein
MNYETTSEARKAIIAAIGEDLKPNMKVGISGKHIMGDFRYFAKLTITDPELYSKPMDACTSDFYGDAEWAKYGEAIRKVKAWVKTSPRNTINGTAIL